jgi:hypothetical protein
MGHCLSGFVLFRKKKDEEAFVQGRKETNIKKT